MLYLLSNLPPGIPVHKCTRLVLCRLRDLNSCLRTHKTLEQTGTGTYNLPLFQRRFWRMRALKSEGVLW